jgi:hypothetical protein
MFCRSRQESQHQDVVVHGSGPLGSTRGRSQVPAQSPKVVFIRSGKGMNQNRFFEILSFVLSPCFCFRLRTEVGTVQRSISSPAVLSPQNFCRLSALKEQALHPLPSEL